jgi:apolipoprotein N-acyltransferase
VRWALVTVAAGWLYGLAFPPTARWESAWLALAPLIVVARLRGARAAAGLGALYAVAGTCATVDWLPRTIAVYYAQPVALGLALFVAVTLLMVVPPVAAFAATVSLTAAAPVVIRMVVAGAAWTATELWRAHALGGNPWVLLGYSQARVGAVAQLADLAGPYGIGFVVVVVNAAIAEAALALGGRTRPRDAIAAVVVAIALVAATVHYGVRAGETTSGDGDATPVLVVQGNLDLGAQWRQELYGENLERYLRLTMEAARVRRPALAVWPEGAFTFMVATEPAYRMSLASVLHPFGIELVAGGPYAVPDAANAYRNSAFVIDPSGTVRGRYDKERLLPFAEYFPFGSLDVVRRSFGRVREFGPGDPSPRPLPTVAGRAGLLICNEAMFPELARARVRDGAELLLALTNDTWVGSPKFAGIAFDMTVLRAIETRRWMVRASTAGPSAIIDPTGVVREMAAYDTTATVAGDVAPRTGLTVYARWGDAFAVACAVVAVLAAIAGFMRRARDPEAA